MSDFADDASGLTEAHIERSLKNRELSKKQPTVRHDCEECGIVLEPHRVEYGICVDCQEEFERLEELRKVRGM